MEQVKIVLVGIGGYGHHYVRQLLRFMDTRKDYTIVGAVDPKPALAPGYADLKNLDIPIYETLSDFYRHRRADLAIISSPIHFHCQQTCQALAEGSHVLCEKPVSAVIQDGYRMLEAQKQTGKMVGIGYQWSFSKAVLDLKRDIMAGKLGQAQLLKTLILWPRNHTYFSRGWAGKQKDSQGNWILDSVANNAAAHYLHNMVYLLGAQLDESATIKQITAELYKANPIENYDTCVFHAVTDQNTDLLYYASHAVNKSIGPVFEYRFSNAVVRYDDNQPDPQITAAFADGSVKSYGNPSQDGDQKLWTMLDAIKTGQSVPCGITAGLTQTICINGAQESMPVISVFPEDMVKHDPRSDVIYCEGLAVALQDLYFKESMPADEGLSWAKPGKCLNMMDYKHFPSFR